MRVVVLGAGGKLGQKIVASCLARGHEVTAAARNPDQFRRSWATISSLPVRTAKVDVMESAALDAALAGQDALVSAAGNVADGQAFVDLFDRVTSSAERVMGGERRVWMLAGAAVLDIPQAGRIGIGLPFVPNRYRPHLANWRRLERSRLDWALMCPGPMVAGDDRPIVECLQTSVNALPFAVGAWARFAPPIGLSLMMKSKLHRLKVPYRAVADVMSDAVEPGGPFSRSRVGIGWSDSELGLNKERIAA